MHSLVDLSNLDKKYFINNLVYNCPYCKRNNVKYSLEEVFEFNWTDDKEAYGYLVVCSSCGNKSLHLSHKDIASYSKAHEKSFFYSGIDIDTKIFYSRPSSHFTLDNRIPRKIRDLIFESEQARQANLLVGASACLRKAIYQLVEKEGSLSIDKTNRIEYKKSIKSLKEKLNFVDSTLFDALSSIQEMTSDNLHENSWEAWDSNKLKFLIELVKTILDEIYVIPDVRKKRISELHKMQGKLKKEKTITS